MRKALAMLVSAVIAACLLCSCSNVERAQEPVDGRFEGTAGVYTVVLTDTETGVQYLYVKCGYGGGVTVLVDADGRPLTKEGA